MKISAAKLSALASLVTVAGGLYAAWQWFQNARRKGGEQLLSEDNIRTVNAVAVLPSSDMTDPGFSGYARRLDLETPLDLADQPILYGQTVPQ